MDELKLNEIVVRPVATANTGLVLGTALYNIASDNTIEARSQSVATETGNEHTIIKTANESLIGTKISAGELSIMDTSTANLRQQPTLLAQILFF